MNYEDPHLASGEACRDLHAWGLDHEPLEPCIKCVLCGSWVRPEHMNTPCVPRTRDLLHPPPSASYGQYQMLAWTVAALAVLWMVSR